MSAIGQSADGEVKLDEEEDRFVMALRKMKVRIQCIADKNCANSYAILFCMDFKECRVLYSRALRQYDAYKSYIQKHNCARKHGKAKQICDWHGHCAALHLDQPHFMISHCKGFISYVHSHFG